MKLDYAILCPMKEEFLAVLNDVQSIKAPTVFLDDQTIDEIEFPLKDYLYDHAMVGIFRNENDSLPVRIGIFQIGIGRSESSYNLGRILQVYAPKHVIICGVAGAIDSNLKIGDVVYGESVRVVDFNLGQEIPTGLASMKESTNISLPLHIKTFIDLLKIKPANILTVDRFVYEKEKEELNKKYSGSTIDMESGHLYYLCVKENIPCLIFRAISDELYGDAESSFEKNLPIAAKNVAETVLGYICYNSIVEEEIKSKLTFIKDFPKKGINFLDIQTLLKYPQQLDYVLDILESRIRSSNEFINKIVALDARGFIFGALLADRLNLPLIMARKKGKLPQECYESTYIKEYGEDIVEIEKSALDENDRILVVDDIAVTFGSISAVIDCIEQAGATVNGIAVLATIGYNQLVYKDRKFAVTDFRDINLYSVLQIEED